MTYAKFKSPVNWTESPESAEIETPPKAVKSQEPKKLVFLSAQLKEKKVQQ